MHVHLLELARTQRDLVAAWQLLDAGWTTKTVRHHAAEHRWCRIHSGVYALTQAPLTDEQRRMAATLTAPGSFLAYASAGAHYGIRSFNGRFETIVRHGNGGPRQHPRVLVSHSKTLDGNTTVHDGIPITSPERTLIDLAAHTDPARPLREALRLKLLTPYSLAVSLDKHRTRRGTNKLRALNDHYSGIPYSRCRSDAEAKALEILHDAGADPDAVNEEIGGAEADLIYRRQRIIIEIDGPQYHQVAAEDARRQAIWEQAGYTVRRISSDDVYGAPAQLIARAPRL